VLVSHAVADLAQVACLRSLPVQQLNFTPPAVGFPSYISSNVGSFGPFVDGNVIPAQPADVGVQVPFIFGSSG